MKRVLHAQDRVLQEPAYNWFLHTAPLRSAELAYYHWHIEMSPRTSRPAGFRVGGRLASSQPYRRNGALWNCGRPFNSFEFRVLSFELKTMRPRLLNLELGTRNLELRHAHRHLRRHVRSGPHGPPHRGEQCRDQAALDEVWFLPSYRPPHKSDLAITRFENRCDMLELALAGHPGFKVERIEKELPPPSYTARRSPNCTAATRGPSSSC